MNVFVKKLHEDSVLPTRGSEFAAAYDVYAYIPEGEVTIAPHTTVKIGTGLSFAPGNDYYVAVYARSGLSTKEGLRPANCTGICDPDYTGEYIVAMHNDSEVSRTVKNGDRIAQIMLKHRLEMEFTIVDELPETTRGAGGFGSTGKQ